MAVQFNLLPDIKLEFDRQQRTKRLVYTLSFLVSAVVIAICVISFVSVNVIQAKLLSNANNDINTYSQKLKSIPNLDKVLTIQNQLNSLPALHQKNHLTSRLFTYLPQVTPVKINIGKLSLDTTASTIEISGTADSVETINKYIDTLKFTSFKVDNNSDTKPAFTNVLLSNVDRNSKNAVYTINASFDPLLFDATQNITLVVPQQTTTRSVVNTPDTGTTKLFDGQTGDKPSNQQGGQ